MGWYAAAALILVAGVALIIVSRDPVSASGPPKVNVDHWHAALGVNVCGTWLPDEQTFEDAEGLHTHGDGLMHIHPFLARAAGENATVGLYLEVGSRNFHADKDSFKVWDGQEHKTGDECDGKPAEVRWALNGEEQDGNISDYRVQDQDQIVIALLPKDEEIPPPPSAPALAAPSDLEPTVPGPGATITVPGDIATTVPADTATTAPAATDTTPTTGAPTATSTP
jgi:hypothetical protein